MLDYAIRELIRRPRRAIAAIAGYTVAVAFLAILAGTLEHQTKLADSVLTGTGTHFIAYTPLCGTETCENTVLDEANEGFYANMVKSKLMSSDLAVIARQSPAIADASAFLLFKIKDDTGTGLFLGGVPQAESLSVKNNSCSATDIVAGRFFEARDRGVVILEESFALAHALSLESELVFSGRPFNVIGIVNPGIRPAKADVYMPIDEATSIINRHVRLPLEGRMNILLVESKGAEMHEDAMRDIKNLLGDTSLISTYGCFKPAALVLGINDAGVRLASVIIYLGMLAFVLKSQYASVLERRHEIGILSVIGWKNSRIAFQLLLESVLQSVAGFLSGALIATALMLLLLMEVPLTTLLLCLAISVSGGVIAGIIPGLIQANKKPAENLRRV